MDDWHLWQRPGSNCYQSSLNKVFCKDCENVCLSLFLLGKLFKLFHFLIMKYFVKNLEKRATFKGRYAKSNFLLALYHVTRLFPHQNIPRKLILCVSETLESPMQAIRMCKMLGETEWGLFHKLLLELKSPGSSRLAAAAIIKHPVKLRVCWAHHANYFTVQRSWGANGILAENRYNDMLEVECWKKKLLLKETKDNFKVSNYEVKFPLRHV